MNAPAGTPGGAEVVLVTGMSGSGKSVALHALEDAGYFCCDNLPPELLRDFIRLEQERFTSRVAVAVDVRTAGSLPQLLPLVRQLRDEGQHVRVLFLDASPETLLRRFSETRRPHPLTAVEGELSRALVEALEMERQLLSSVRDIATVVDTSQLRPAQLRTWVRDLVGVPPAHLTLVFESFAFKHGVPLDADLVFDVRVLPNPFYIRELRPLTGRDEPVAQYLRAQPEVETMIGQIEAFVRHWLPALRADQRAYLTVCVGCTGGQHRSVFITETLAARFRREVTTLVRHRELDAKADGH
ncbi:RNase adapter RapZ [Rubrivivax albus]|uniref:RNase adapter RapZ n=1 Tax=Rubrivivax albus TaxID=2499835 RepID=A0A437JZL8_9BURK|nr:RNase adapter RapZ [Rubrivivax albus]RVT53548.1 RNase adapter RapZ [Rubrivivax albus]